MPDTTMLERFLNEKTCKDNDDIEILGGGAFIQKDDPQKAGSKYIVLHVPVKNHTSGRELTWNVDSSALRLLNAKHGTDSDKWKGVRFKSMLYPKTVYGSEKIYIKPVFAQ